MFEHYLDAIMGEMDTIQTLESATQCAGCYTSIDNDIFTPKLFYVSSDEVPITFDSGCTIAVTPYMSDFFSTYTPVNKTIKGLSGSVKAVGQ